MKVTVIPTETVALGTDTKGLINGLKSLEIRVLAHPIDSIFKFGENPKENLESWGDFLLLRPWWKTGGGE